MSATIQKVLSEVEQLSLEDKEYVKETLEKILIEERRIAIKQRSEEALQNYHSDRSKSGTVADLMAELND